MPQTLQRHTYIHTYTYKCIVICEHTVRIITMVARTYYTSKVGIILEELAYRVVRNQGVTVTEVVGIVVAHKIHSSVVRSGVITTSLWKNSTK